MTQSPAFIIAAPSSGSGKTLITLGLLRAFHNRGIRIASFKTGPDYIDPQFHELASGRACFNLDPWAMTSTSLSNSYSATAEGVDLVIGEGVMGLFDGAQDGTGSTADLADKLQLPIILVIDAKGQSASVAAILHGFNSYRPQTKIAGVIFNRVGSQIHADMLKTAADKVDIPTLGFIPHATTLHMPSRHLGLVQASENKDIEAFIEQAAALITENVDLGHLAKTAKAPVLASQKHKTTPPGRHIAVAKDIAFAFSYPHLLKRWEENGARLSFFSPLANEAPSLDADFIYLPGGYPELHADALSKAGNFKAGMKDAADRGASIYGECGGYMTLGRTLTDKEGNCHPMLGLLPIDTSFAEPKRHLGYRKVSQLIDTPFGNAGSRHMAHEFHYASEMQNDSATPLFEIENARGNNLGKVGAVSGNVCGSFIHLIDQVS
ncbi:cobyrinate a,c-diamide synthase [Sneathiella sp. P13V-1]|uniref:cobyrinate a,c-diamide synthase n=1 Tax=Sneathiella sp. P13V-1 TaxID=2697366 RepID=UPI00187B79EC|nr:cobyrinate a,c-diamide synthase [Sneathiella sp. P13V-1]MBE7638145.1 cobyrinate a,c-diamide synthase [Sneathiella sp. P13V-1]